LTIDERETWKVEIGRDGYPKTGNLMVDRRITKHVDALVENRFEAAVKEWAASDTGQLRTRFGTRELVSRESVLLCEALGLWAFVEPAEVFPPTEEDYLLRGGDIFS
jgi:hypothetical protein